VAPIAAIEPPQRGEDTVVIGIIPILLVILVIDEFHALNDGDDNVSVHACLALSFAITRVC
jgi:hypothetical protein